MLNHFLEKFSEKIGRFIKIEFDLLKPKRVDREEREYKKKEESLLVLNRIGEKDFLILCDEKGEMFTSEEFSVRLEKVLELGRRRVVLAIGGAYGFSEEIRGRADLIWSFSRMTINHHLAYGVAMEQLYRAFTIIKGISYHNK